MAVTDMHDTDGICRKAGMQQTQLFPKRIENAKAIRQLIFTKLLKAGRKSYLRNSNSIRTLGIGTERVTICRDFADKGAGWNRVLSTKGDGAEEEKGNSEEIF